MKPTLHVLVSGAGIAGPALALCLGRFGIRTTLVEKAPALRPGGQAVDFRGPVHRDVLERMGLWDAIHALRTRPSPLVLLDPCGAPCATLPEVMMSGDVEILRGDLSGLLHERTRTSAEYRFGDQITTLRQEGERVAVAFEHAAPQHFDLVVGADGLHSAVRALVFGEEQQLLRHHGYRVATYALQDVTGLPHEACVYSVPGRAVSKSVSSAAGSRAMLIWKGGPLTAPERHDVAAQKRLLHAVYDGTAWETSRFLAALDDANDLYLDAIATVHVDRYARGSVVLLGDAAYGGTLGGSGTPLAMVGACVLAGALAHSDNVASALARYEASMRPYAMRCQKFATRVGPFFAPGTPMGLWFRNHAYAALTSPRMLATFERWLREPATDFALPAFASS